MVVHKSDTVATVLRQDESLIQVFVELSPAFQRLRNPAMRKVMSRLVTIEQAARIAGVDGDELVRRLNRAAQSDAGAERGTSGEASAPRAVDVAGRPAVLDALAPGAVVEVDVREDLRTGREPFSRIMLARRTVPDGGVLSVRAIFEPVPLYAVMAKQGLDHWTEQLGADDWRVWFYPAGSRTAEQPSRPRPAQLEKEPPANEDVVVLDVRNMEPPEPMVRTLAALEELPPGGTLVQINVRVPQFLLPRLDEAGYSYEVREQSPDLVRVFIRRAAADGAASHTTQRG